jgi:hypothetical protein
MISDYVMSEKNCRRKEIVQDSVGMGAYNMDSHNTQRYVTKEGFVRNEGDVEVGTRPYPISYRSLRPKAEECSNLLVPVCLAASHIAYGSIRMEPVFMVLGQSAATAAAQAIEQGATVQAIDGDKLKARLLADHQVLVLADHQVLDFESPATSEGRSFKAAELGGIVVDDEQAERHGFESSGHTAPPWVNEGYRHDNNEGKGQQTARFTPNIPKAGTYQVAVAYPALKNRATNVPVTIHSAEGDKTVTLNEQKKGTIKDLLQPVGVFRFEAGTTGWVEISNAGTNGHVIIDAVQWLEAPLVLSPKVKAQPRSPDETLPRVKGKK